MVRLSGFKYTSKVILKLSTYFAAMFFLIAVFSPAISWGLASNNIPLDSPIYTYIDKLAGFGLIDTDVHGLKPYSKAEAARLVIEAEENLKKLGAGRA